MRVAIIGANGQVGSDLCRVLAGEEVIPFVQTDFDVRDHAAAAAALERARPEVVVNTSAYHRVDDCETEVERAFAVNAVAVHHLARWCAARDAAFVHFSTDYVFDGDGTSPREEGDLAEPASVYGASKLAGEWLVRQAGPRHILVRTSGLYGLSGSVGKGGVNFVELMLRLGREGKPLRVVADQVLTPTYTLDLATTLAGLIRGGHYGLFHVTNTGQCSWYEFARAIFALAGIDADLSPTTTAEYGARARRPAYSVLKHSALLKAGLDDLPPWRDALQRYLSARRAAGLP